ncbi:MAG: alpha/beta hydrolase [Actinomycetota bacterium]|nr:alpha/beta hydrolase [Actinomycetota bacterium]
MVAPDLSGPGRSPHPPRPAYSNYPLEDEARRLTVPTFVVHSSQDPLVPALFARRLAGKITQGAYVEVSAAHAMPYGAPRKLAQLILNAGGDWSLTA